MLTRHIRESLQVTPGPFPNFWVGPGDEATDTLQCLCIVLQTSLNFVYLLMNDVPSYNFQGLLLGVWTPL